jgi:hypothetical protein
MRAMLDTGAPGTVLSRAAAQKAGIDLTGPDAKADGVAHGIGIKGRNRWVVRLKTFDIGGETIANTPISVIDQDLDSEDAIIGMDFSFRTTCWCRAARAGFTSPIMAARFFDQHRTCLGQVQYGRTEYGRRGQGRSAKGCRRTGAARFGAAGAAGLCRGDRRSVRRHRAKSQ